jgi:hypothetical protein
MSAHPQLAHHKGVLPIPGQPKIAHRPGLGGGGPKSDPERVKKAVEQREPSGRRTGGEGEGPLPFFRWLRPIAPEWRSMMTDREALAAGAAPPWVKALATTP